jgi:anthranilate phosphoribosyltransferase
VALNASLALQVGNVIPLGAHQQGIELAKTVMGSGVAWDKLAELVKFLNMRD